MSCCLLGMRGLERLGVLLAIVVAVGTARGAESPADSYFRDQDRQRAIANAESDVAAVEGIVAGKTSERTVSFGRALDTAWQTLQTLRTDPVTKAREPAFRARLVNASKTFGQQKGGDIGLILGDGDRPASIDADSSEAASKLENGCSSQGLGPNLAKLARSDPGALRGKNEGALVDCELKAQTKAAEDVDTFDWNASSGPKGTFRTCSVEPYYVRAMVLHHGLGPWESVSAGEPAPVNCNQVPSRPRGSPTVLSLIRRIYGRPPGVVFVSDTPMAVRREGRDVYRYAMARGFARDTEFRKNACDEIGDDVVCTATGSRPVSSYDKTRFYLARASARRQEHDADRCKQMLAEASKAAADMVTALDEAAKESSKVRLKTRNDGIFSLAQLRARATTLKDVVEGRRPNAWCGGDGADDRRFAQLGPAAAPGPASAAGSPSPVRPHSGPRKRRRSARSR